MMAVVWGLWVNELNSLVYVGGYELSSLEKREDNNNSILSPHWDKNYNCYSFREFAKQK